MSKQLSTWLESIKYNKEVVEAITKDLISLYSSLDENKRKKIRERAEGKILQLTKKNQKKYNERNKGVRNRTGDKVNGIRPDIH